MSLTYVGIPVRTISEYISLIIYFLLTLWIFTAA